MPQGSMGYCVGVGVSSGPGTVVGVGVPGPVSVPGAGPVQNVMPGVVATGTCVGAAVVVRSQGMGMPVCIGFSVSSIQSVMPVPSRPLLFEVACLITPGGTVNVVCVKG